MSYQWSFDCRTGYRSESDSEEDFNHKYGPNNTLSLKDFDLSSREDKATIKLNPFLIAKLNAATRNPSASEVNAPNQEEAERTCRDGRCPPGPPVAQAPSQVIRQPPESRSSPNQALYSCTGTKDERNKGFFLAITPPMTKFRSMEPPNDANLPEEIIIPHFQHSPPHFSDPIQNPEDTLSTGHSTGNQKLETPVSKTHPTSNYEGRNRGNLEEIRNSALWENAAYSPSDKKSRSNLKGTHPQLRYDSPLEVMSNNNMQSITPFTPIKKNCRTKHSLDVNRLYYSPEPNKSRRILDQVDESSPIQQRLPTKKTRSPLRPSSHAAFRDNDVWSTLPKRKKLAVKEKRKKSFVETGRFKMPLDRLVQAQGSPSPCRRFSYRPPPKQSLKGTADEGGWKVVRGPGNIADYSNTWYVLQSISALNF